MSGWRWTEEEEEALETMISSYPVAHIANRLGRSFDSVNLKLNRMGLSGFEKSTDLLTLHQLCLMMGVESRTVKKKWRDHGLRIMKRGHYLVVRQEHLIKFLKDHPEDWNAADVTEDSLIVGFPWYKEKRRQDKKSQYHWTAEDVARLRLLRRRGFTIREIAETMGRSESSIKYKLYPRGEK